MAQAALTTLSPDTTDTADAPHSILSPELEKVTILALRMSSRRRLGMFLNMEAVPQQNGLLPNFQGLAELIGFEFVEQMSFQRERDPTQALLMEWGNRPELNPTLGALVQFLGELERLDVLEECREIMKKDAEHYLAKKQAGSSDISPVQDSTVSQSPMDIDDMGVDETSIMTIQDVEAGKPTFYDAFVCYHPEGEDLGFVKKLIEKVENPPFNLRLFVPHRDDLPGASKYVISAKLIQERCKRMVIVMSPRYLQSEACDFQTKFAHALSPGSRSKKLVPVLVKFCVTPNILRHVTMCDYTRGDMVGWFWDRLVRTLQAPLSPRDITVDSPNKLAGLEMTLADQSATLSSTLSSSPPPPATTTTATTAREGSGGESPGLGVNSLPAVDQDAAPEELSPAGKGGVVRKKGVTGSPVASTPPPSPSPDRKGGQKKKGLRSKLSSVFSSHSSSSSS